jgi:hypothetical protein
MATAHHAEGPSAGAGTTEPASAEAAVSGGAASGSSLPPARHVRERLDTERWTLPESLVARVRSVAGRHVGERLEAATRGFLGVPYLHEAAGEGAGVDPDPPATYGRFDCLTFVEEMLGVVLAADPLGGPTVRNALRYADGRVRYEDRHHFMEAGWIPAALRSGLLVDITDRIGRARTLTRTVTDATWRGWRRRALFHLPDARLPVGTWALRYLDLAEARRVADSIPPGAVLLTIRAPRSALPYAVTHVSLVVSDGGKVSMRHASRMGAQRVRDDSLAWYLWHLGEYPRWPAIGVGILYPRDIGPRRSGVGPAPWDAPPLPGEALRRGMPPSAPGEGPA